MDRATVPGLLERVRWHNVARLGALLGLAALVLLWPHLSAPPPSLPPARPVPVRAAAGPSPLPAPA
ncbi:MAG: hypothetical protein JWN65_3919, partial [Solirubrobacterales bacterium]|nr:hypothetical protein [Solirubrobacterales bacterium]